MEAKPNPFTTILISNVEAAYPEQVRCRPLNLQYNDNWFNDDLRSLRDTRPLLQEVYQRTKHYSLQTLL